MADRLKTSYGVYENDDFVEENDQLRELTVTITLSEYRELVASSVLQRDFNDQIDDLTQAVDTLCAMVFEHVPSLSDAALSATKLNLSPTVFESFLRVAKERDTDGS